jgi:Lon protease-like protein
MAIDTLPVFPLGAVLFPGTALPLHLFEPRYRQLLTDVRAGDSRFVLLPSIDGTAERALPPGRMGCVAEVERVEMLADGRSNILVVGRERVMLEAFIEHPAPYHVATVSVVADEQRDSAVALAVLADNVVANFRRVVRAVQTMNGNAVNGDAMNGSAAAAPELPDQPAQLAWTIASMIDLDAEQRYALLASRSPADRLTNIDAVLRRVLPDLELRAALAAARPST